MTDLAPTAYACRDGVPGRCRQIAVWNYWDRLNPKPDKIVGLFLVDACYYEELAAQPLFGKWRELRTGRCIYACWRGKTPLDGSSPVRHKLHLEVWRLAGREVPDGYFVGFENKDFFDCRLENLIPIPIRLPGQSTIRMNPFLPLDRSNVRVAPRPR